MSRKPLPLPRLLVLAALGACASCAVGPGPPPTPPGADAAFDEHLARLDPLYRFLFADSTRLFEAGMTGPEEDVLLDVAAEARTADVTLSSRLELSPNGRSLLVPYYVQAFADHGNRRLLLLDVHSREVRHVSIPADDRYGLDAMGADNELCHWVAADRFVVSMSHYPDGGGIRKRFLSYDLADLDTPRELDFGHAYPVLRTMPGRYEVLWASSDDPGDRMRVRALDGTGFREATPAERDAFYDLWVSNPPNPEGAENFAARVVVESHVNSEPLFDFEEKRSHWDILLDGRLVRRTFSASGPPNWDADLKLYTWSEYSSNGGETFVMDAKGRYRSWHQGRWIAKIGRGSGGLAISRAPRAASPRPAPRAAGGRTRNPEPDGSPNRAGAGSAAGARRPRRSARRR